VLALLLTLLAQAGTGLFANDDIASEGPLAKFISKDWSDRLTWFHADVNAPLIFVLVGLHVAAIGWYWFGRREDLVKPMFSGDTLAADDAPHADDTWGRRALAAVLLAACAGVVAWVVNLPA